MARSNPNYPPDTPETAKKDDPFSFLDIDELGALREEQKRILLEEQARVKDPLYDKAGMRDAELRARARYDEIRIDYLRSFDAVRALDEDGDEYQEYFNWVAQASIDNMTDLEWSTEERDKLGRKITPSGREMVTDLHDELLQDYLDSKKKTSDPSDPPSPPDDEPTSELYDISDLEARLEQDEKLRHALDEARDKLADMALKRQGRAREDMQEEFDEIHKEYLEALIKRGKFLQEQYGEDRTDQQKTESAVLYLDREGKELRDLTNDKWAETPVGRFCTFLARGSFATRVAKGLMISAGAGTAAALVTAASGGTAVGGAFIGGTGAIAGAGRILRGYGAVRGAAGGMAGTLTHEGEVGLLQSVNSSGVEGGARHLANVYEEAIYGERKKNVKASVLSVGSLVVGATVISELAPLLDAHGSRLVHGASDYWHRTRSYFGY